MPPNKKTFLAVAFILTLLVSALAGTQFVSLGVANFLPSPPELPYVYIRADGTVEPQILPIQRVGETYTFTGNIANYTIKVQRDNIVIDGTGYTLQGNGKSRAVAPKTALPNQRCEYE